MSLRRLLSGLAFAVAIGLAHDVSAGPDPEKLKNASESFEAGARAFKAKSFVEAASHFEAADAAVPSAKALRLAIRARAEAGNASRAASLAALALERYPDDPDTKKLANETLDKTAGGLHRVDITCASACLLAADARIVHGEPATKWTVFVDPGKVTLGASFGKRTAPEQSVDATAGGSSTLQFEPPKDTPGVGAGGAGAAGAGGSTAAGGEGGGVVVGTEPETDDSWGIHPAPFIVGLIATAALGGVTIWSGVDTLNNPGPDAVRAACAGKDENCPLYQDGQAKEVRTNALIGATAGTAAITLVLAIVTDWGGSEDPVTEALLGPRKTASQRVPRLWVNVGNAKGLSGASEPDVVVHLSGDF